MQKGVIIKLSALMAAVGVAVLLWAAPALASARVVGSENGSVEVSQSDTVDGAAFLAGKTVNVYGTIKGDLYCAAEVVRISGTVEGDVLCAGSDLTIDGEVAGDVRAIGATVNVKGKVAGSVSLAGSVVTIDKSANVGLDALMAGSSVIVDGTVQRDVRASSGAMDILGTVGRGVDAEVQNLTVAENAKVAGDVHYWSANEAVVFSGSVAGDVKRHDPIVSAEMKPTLGQSVMNAVSGIVFLVVLALALVLLMPRSVREITALSIGKLGIAIAIGVGAIFIAIPLLLVLVITIVGIPVALLVFVAYIVLFTIALPLSAYYLGRWMLEGRANNMLLHVMTGSVVLGVIMAIPVVGGVVGFIAFSAGIGMALFGLKKQFGPRAYDDTYKLSGSAKSGSAQKTKKDGFVDSAVDMGKKK